uniref:Secreted protein n=1 Tax=Timema cristinae TaxID=61476 RepID=A0A7R9CYI2_TIMCR|nr:unnamed protein product [Timema cristinae]
MVRGCEQRCSMCSCNKQCVALCLAWALLLQLALAGFSCLSNPCLYGICMDDINRLTLTNNILDCSSITARGAVKATPQYSIPSGPRRGRYRSKVRVSRLVAHVDCSQSVSQIVEVWRRWSIREPLLIRSGVIRSG